MELIDEAKDLPDNLKELYNKLVVGISLGDEGTMLNSSLVKGNTVLFRTEELSEKVSKESHKQTFEVKLIMLVDDFKWLKTFTNPKLIPLNGNKLIDKKESPDKTRTYEQQKDYTFINESLSKKYDIVSNVHIANIFQATAPKNCDTEEQFYKWYESTTGKEEVLEFEINLMHLNILYQSYTAIFDMVEDN